MTPLQETVYRLIADYEARNERKLSGRELSAMIGKSRNHLSQIMNDGLVPSGEVLLKLGEALEADEETQRQLVLDAMRTKIGDRARDTFWLRHALELTDSLVERVDGFEEFLSQRGMLDDFKRWEASAPAHGSSENGGASSSHG